MSPAEMINVVDNAMLALFSLMARVSYPLDRSFTEARENYVKLCEARAAACDVSESPLTRIWADLWRAEAEDHRRPFVFERDATPPLDESERLRRKMGWTWT